MRAAAGITVAWAASAAFAVLAAGVVPPPGSQGGAVAAMFSLDDAVRAARAHAAQQTGAAPESLGVTAAEAVTWSDGSLGCPQPGRLYTQALVPGYRVRLTSPAGVLSYHFSLRGTLVLCAPGRAVEPVPGVDRS